MSRANESYAPDELGYLPAYCWCRRKIVRVPAHDVRHARTMSCGSPNCYPGCKPDPVAERREARDA